MYQYGVDVMFNGALHMHRAQGVLSNKISGTLRCPSCMQKLRGEG